MKTHIKLMLGLAISILANNAFSAQAHSVKSDAKVHIPQLQTDNFTRRLSCDDWYGYYWCSDIKGGDPSIETCMPIENKAHHVINFSIQHFSDITIDSSDKKCTKGVCVINAGKIETVYTRDKVYDSLQVEVTNTKTGVQIYNGPIKDLVGLTCNGNKCRDWKRPKNCPLTKSGG